MYKKRICVALWGPLHGDDNDDDGADDDVFALAGACGGELACSTCHVVFPKVRNLWSW